LADVGNNIPDYILYAPNYGPRCYLCGQKCGDQVFRRTVL